jgi:hypothetical protein
METLRMPQIDLDMELGFHEFLYNVQVPSNSLQERFSILRRSQKQEPKKEKELTIEITSSCDLECSVCSTNSVHDRSSELSTRDIESILTEFPDFKKVRLSGGEPFKHPYLLDIVKLLKKQNKRIEILTCGVKDYQPIDGGTIEKIRPYIDKIVFSIHGPHGLHDKIVMPNETSPTEYWNILMTSVMNTVWNKVAHSYHTVVLLNNFNSLGDLAVDIATIRDIVFARGRYKRMDYPVNWHLLRFVKQGRGAENPDLALNPDQLMEFPTLVKYLSNRYFLQITYTNSFDMKACDCGLRKAVVTSDGTRIDCSALKYGSESGRFACKKRI